MLVSGCATTLPLREMPYNSYLTGGEFGDDYGYNNYEFEIISDPPGAKIEWNNDYIGTTPIRRVYNGVLVDTIVITANPIYPGQYVQTKTLSEYNPLP